MCPDLLFRESTRTPQNLLKDIKTAYLQSELDRSVPATLRQKMIDRIVDKGFQCAADGYEF